MDIYLTSCRPRGSWYINMYMCTYILYIEIISLEDLVSPARELVYKYVYVYRYIIYRYHIAGGPGVARAGAGI